MDDQYQTIASPSTGEYKDKGSKFLSFCFPFDDESQLTTILDNIKSQHPKARHYCYAYNIGLDHNRFRINDDGEPSGTAGKPIFGQILSHHVTNIIIVIVRYFGGTKLGVSGLIQAYKEASISGLSSANIIIKHITKQYILSFEYAFMGRILAELKDLEIDIDSKDFSTRCKVIISIRSSDSDIKLRKLKANLLEKTINEVDMDTQLSFCHIDEII